MASLCIAECESLSLLAFIPARQQWPPSALQDVSPSHFWLSSQADSNDLSALQDVSFCQFCSVVFLGYHIFFTTFIISHINLFNFIILISYPGLILIHLSLLSVL